MQPTTVRVVAGPVSWCLTCDSAARPRCRPIIRFVKARAIGNDLSVVIGNGAAHSKGLENLVSHEVQEGLVCGSLNHRTYKVETEAGVLVTIARREQQRTILELVQSSDDGLVWNKVL